MKIIPSFDIPAFDPGLYHHLESVKAALEEVYPDHFPKNVESKVIWTNHGLTLGIVLVCSQENTLGVGRYMNDVCSRSLVPGKLVNLSSSFSMAFKIDGIDNEGYFLHKVYARLKTEEDLKIALKTLLDLPKEIGLNIEAVRYLRDIFQSTPLSLEEKNRYIHETMKDTVKAHGTEGIHTLLGTNKESEHLTELTRQILATNKISPEVFSREIFQELQQLIFSMKEDFLLERSNNFISRLLAQSYLLRKTCLLKERDTSLQLEIKFLNPPHKRDEFVHSLGILAVIRFKSFSENIDCNGLFDSVHTILPDCKFVPGSSFSYFRPQEGVKSLYIEIAKEGEFGKSTLNNLKKKLPFEIDEKVFRPVLPIFMPRNEEEVMKHMILLSKELKYVDDIPQVMLNFYKQTPHTLSFTTIIVALNRGHSLNIPIENIEKRIMGNLRSKYPKEAFVFELTIDKAPFIRKDRSIDLFDARKAASMRLLELIGPFRDYNGGLILKKSEILLDFKKLVKPYTIGSEVFLERFFHAITPSYMQGVLQPTILKRLFLLLTKATDLSCENGFFEHQVFGDTLIIGLATTDTHFKTRFKPSLEKLKIPSSQLAMTHFDQYGISAIGLILRHFEEEIIQQIRDCFFQWIDEQKQQLALEMA
ncbi:MAG: hypothetical protein FJZ61_04010 [Chlamydiae bacterium]|nr:hypothetical protein [Chlamydiota bacterium]